MIIKVCGMRDAANIRAVEALGIECMGFIFYDKSPRFVSNRPACGLDLSCDKVGVFVNADIGYVYGKAKEYQLDWLQLHGDETPEYCRRLLSRFDNWEHQVGIFKTIHVSTPDDLQKTEGYGKAVDTFVFEPKCEGYGGSGTQFDWSVLEYYKGETPFLLTGGIGPGDAERIKAFRHPKFSGIDLNSRFETAPGLKNVQALEQFIKTIRQ